ncbi:zinc finger HIT domain-containing protein 2-like [Contarinia nasturtii]|uniref:zinc finger HIT domain-containing protein 2-like n=1 Tax=Contarinia nasturtii TaxID=265458 RepID=UPI0012D40DD5|nr:zinc finger HIT domain-containing protein 2-like [Contarinia nasturtii]
MITMSSNKLCQICSKGTQKYNCPRCNLSYCSVECYKSPSHLKCSEEFYKECVLEEMSAESKMKKATGRSSGDEDVKKMYEMLKRVESQQQDESDFEHSDDDEPLDSDDDEDSADAGDLSKRLEGIDLNDADAIWSKLTESERQEFNQIVQSEDVTSLLPTFNAWWENKIKRKLVTELNGDENDEVETIVDHPQIVESIVDFARISTKTPASCVLNNLINVLAAYASMVRYFYGEYNSNKIEAVNYLVAVCANLRTNANFDDSDVAIESIRHDALNEGYAIDEHDVKQMRRDVSYIMEGPIQDNQTNIFVLAALSDLHRLLLAVKVELKSTQTQITALASVANDPCPSSSKSTNDSKKFTKRFNDQKENICLKLEKGKLTAVTKKIEYYLAYVKKYQ